jgi:voltage-gated potassium channel
VSPVTAACGLRRSFTVTGLRLPHRAATLEGRAAQQARWDRFWTPWLIVAAVLPLVGAADPTQSKAPLLLGVGTWLVFVIDLAVHRALNPKYLSSRVGWFDVGIVVITAPWYLVFGSSGAFVVLARLARLARIAWIGARQVHGVRRLAQRLGSVAIYAGGLMVGCALIVKWTEPPSSGFTTYGDALWWAMVTITTVGYGDLTPVGAVGRIAASVLMLGGVAFLGTLAAAMAAFFGFGETPAGTAADTAVAEPDLAGQVAALREDIARLSRRLPDSSAS